MFCVCVCVCVIATITVFDPRYQSVYGYMAALCVITFARWHDDSPHHVYNVHGFNIAYGSKKEIIHKYYLLSWFSVICISYFYLSFVGFIFVLVFFSWNENKSASNPPHYTHSHNKNLFILSNRNRYSLFYFFFHSMCIVELWISIHRRDTMIRDNLTGCVCVCNFELSFRMILANRKYSMMVLTKIYMTCIKNR